MNKLITEWQSCPSDLIIELSEGRAEKNIFDKGRWAKKVKKTLLLPPSTNGFQIQRL